jgi:hypothetical protein
MAGLRQPFVLDAGSWKPVEPRKRTFHDPRREAQATVVPRAAHGQARLGCEIRKMPPLGLQYVVPKPPFPVDVVPNLTPGRRHRYDTVPQRFALTALTM